MCQKFLSLVNKFNHGLADSQLFYIPCQWVCCSCHRIQSIKWVDDPWVYHIVVRVMLVSTLIIFYAIRMNQSLQCSILTPSPTKQNLYQTRKLDKTALEKLDDKSFTWLWCQRKEENVSFHHSTYEGYSMKRDMILSEYGNRI